MLTQKMRREERERERTRTLGRERDPWPFGSSFYMFFPSPGPALCKLGQPGVLFILPEVLTPVFGPSFVLFSQAFPLSLSHRHSGLLYSQTHVHWVGDASRSLKVLSPFLPVWEVFVIIVRSISCNAFCWMCGFSRLWMNKRNPQSTITHSMPFDETASNDHWYQYVAFTKCLPITNHSYSRSWFLSHPSCYSCNIFLLR